MTVYTFRTYPNEGGGALNPQAEAFLRMIPPYDCETPIETRREALEARLSALGGPECEGVEQRDLLIPGAPPLQARMYTPVRAPTAPIVVFFHGGAWNRGSLTTHHLLAQQLCQLTNCRLLSVAYRLAPEHPFPAAFEDALRATRWVGSGPSELGGVRGPIAIAGDSAGGNLGAAVALQLQPNEIDLRALGLICPALSFRYPTHGSFSEFGGLASYGRTEAEHARALYLQREEDWLDVRASPLEAKTFSSLPPTLVLTAEFDILRDEGERFAELLAKQNVKARATRYTGVVHPFVVLSKLFPEHALAARSELALFLREHLLPNEAT